MLAIGSHTYSMYVSIPAVSIVSLVTCKPTCPHIADTKSQCARSKDGCTRNGRVLRANSVKEPADGERCALDSVSRHAVTHVSPRW